MTPPRRSTASSSSAGQVRPPLHSGPQQPGVPPPGRMVYGHPEETQRPRRPITEEEIRDAKYIALRLRAAQAAYELPARPGEADYAPDVEGTSEGVSPTSPASEPPDDRDTHLDAADRAKRGEQMMREEGTSEGVSPTSPASELPDDRDTHLDVAARAKRGGEMMRENRKKNQENVTRPSRSAATRAADAAAAAAKAASEAARDWSPPGSPTSPSVVTDAPQSHKEW